jgi:hypothetical protein
MTPSTPTNDRRAPASASLPAPVRAGAFWAAVVLPFCAFGLLAIGLSSNVEYAAFVALVTANVLALIVGHDYGTE